MPLYDYKCVSCGAVRADVLVDSGTKATVSCHLCNRPMERQPPGPNFFIHGYSSKNNYSR
jgi:putative FmdB family regulatory protein